MNFSMNNFSLVFMAGLFGGLINSLIVWFLGRLGVPQALGVQIAPPLDAAFIYPELVWGGIWGLLFLVPLGRLTFPVKGAVISLIPSLVQLFLLFPKAHKGILGLQLGTLTPVIVVIYTALWGIPAGLWLQWERPD